MTLTRKLTAAALALSVPMGAHATDATSTFAVSATVIASCVVVGGVPLAFGNYDGTQNDATTTFSVTCTTGTSYTVALDAGGGSGASTTTRKMTYLTNTLDYTLYSDAGRTANWGNNTGVDTVAGTGTGILQGYTVYGRIPAGSTATLGAYADTITITATY